MRCALLERNYLQFYRLFALKNGIKPDSNYPVRFSMWSKLFPFVPVCYAWILKKKTLNAPFYGWGSTASSLEPFWGGGLLFNTKFPEIPGTHFIDLWRMKGWVNLWATQWFWTRDPWIGGPALHLNY